MDKFGKSLIPYIQVKGNSFCEEGEIDKNFKALNEKYLAAPKRKSCKNCEHSIHKVDFSRNGIDYTFCDNCGHLNGMHEDTEEFCNLAYSGDGDEYSQFYASSSKEDYYQRVKSIYKPKADFLVETIKLTGVSPDELSYLDYGAGSGYMIAALIESGLSDVSGFEVSKGQVDYANRVLEKEVVRPLKLVDSINVIRQTEADVVCMIGVLEHLQKPREMLKAIAENPNIKYYFIDLPIFSFSVYLETIFSQYFHRHLSADHTHLYTQQSIKHFCEEYGFSIEASWFFGADASDMMRFFSLELKNASCSKRFIKQFSRDFRKIIDPIQSVFDKNYLCSEVHMVLKKL